MNHELGQKAKDEEQKAKDIPSASHPVSFAQIELRSEEFQEVLGSVPHWILRWGITVLALVVVILLSSSAIIKYPDVIPAQIVLTGSIPPATILARTSGKLKELFVTDNQTVKAGDYLAVIENSAKTEDILFLENYLSSLNHLDGGSSDLSRSSPPQGDFGALQSLYSSFYTTLSEYLEYLRLLYHPQKVDITKERIIQYEQQYRNLQNQQKIIIEQSKLAEKQYQRDSLSYSKGTISNEEIEQSRSKYLQSRLTEENVQSSLQNIQIQIAQLEESLLDISQQDTERLNRLQSQLRSHISQLKSEIQAWKLSYVLTAPLDGTITFTNYWTVNQNVNAGGDVFTVIPHNHEVIGKALLPVARSGKVKAGQKVNIRLENFPDHEYGILRGRIENISLVPSQTNQTLYYTVEISIPNGLITTYKKELPLLPNMHGRAEIITEDISLLERFILPVKKILKESI
jgi:hypothetical protein